MKPIIVNSRFERHNFRAEIFETLLKSRYHCMKPKEVQQIHNTAYVLIWIKGVFDLRKKVRKEAINDIRRYMRIT